MTTSELKKKTISGTFWSLGSYGTSQIVRFGSNLILTHLLAPKLFGIMTLVYTFISGLHLFSDIGVVPLVVQSKRGDDPVFLNTTWTLLIIRAFGIWLFSLVIAWPVSQFYNEPQLLWLLPLVALNTVISGFQCTATFTINRQMAFSKIAILELGGQFFGTTTMLVWAWLNPSIWSLVAGSFISSLFQLIVSYQLISGTKNRFAWDKDVVKEIISFGKWIFFSTLSTFIAMQADRLILPKLISLSLLGVYGIAYVFSDMPRQIVAGIGDKVILPIIAKLNYLPRETLSLKILHSRRLLLLAAAVLLTLLVSFGDMIILVLYDKRYSQAAWMLPILTLGIWPTLLYESFRQVLIAIGQPKYQAYGQFLKAIYMLIALPLGFSWMGILGAVIVIALNDFPLYGAVTYGLYREGLSGIKQDIIFTVIFLILLASVLEVRFLLGFGLPISQLFAT